jgi:undecaprenyl-phosphate 4-deoxy-4-formamido-L-arabinose transferase
MEISIVIPIYKITKNAIAHLPLTIELLRGKYKKFELLFIIDNIGIDKQLQELIILRDKFPEVQIHQLNKNYGQHFATLCGFYLAKGDFIISLDEDMISQIDVIWQTDAYKKTDVFYFYFDKSLMYQSSVRKLLSNIFKYAIHKILKLKNYSSFRILSKDFSNIILKEKYLFWNIDVMIFKHINNVGYAILPHQNYNDKDSSYNLFKLIKFAYEIICEKHVIVANILLLFCPFLIFNLFCRKIFLSLILYFICVLVCSFYFKIKKKNTATTQEKIIQALQK